jgi:hypothetical protein
MIIGALQHLAYAHVEVINCAPRYKPHPVKGCLRSKYVNMRANDPGCLYLYSAREHKADDDPVL